MARNKYYKQCVLTRPVKGKPGAYEQMVSWIPSDKAKKGNVVKLKEWPSDKEWSEGWTVIEVGDRQEGEKVEGRADLWKHQREVSDI